MKPKLIDYEIFKNDITGILKIHNSYIFNLSLSILFFSLIFLILYFRLNRNKTNINREILDKLVYIKNNT